MAKCPDCGLDLSKFGPRHRCTTKITGARNPSKLEADKIARGEMSPADLLPKDKPASSLPAGRLAPRTPPMERPALSRMPQAGCSCRADEVLAAVERLTDKLDRLIALIDKP